MVVDKREKIDSSSNKARTPDEKVTVTEHWQRKRASDISEEAKKKKNNGQKEPPRTSSKSVNSV